MEQFLTKSDFKVARECPAKLYYKKHHYPATTDDDPTLEQFRRTGYIVERIAQLQFPDGTQLEHDLAEARRVAEKTRRWIERTERGTLFEAVVIHDRLLARVDILNKVGDRLELIEVKSTSVDGTESRPLRTSTGRIITRKREYVEDVIFQAQLLERAFPDYHIAPYLCVVDTSMAVDDNCVRGLFRYEESVSGERLGRPLVEYHGDPTALEQRHPLVFLDVRAEVVEFGAEIRQAADVFARSLEPDGVRKLPASLGPKCAKCEYRYHAPAEYDTEGIRDGFSQCWGNLARAEEHIIDLHSCATVGGRNSGTVESLISDGHVDLREIEPKLLSGKLNDRQFIQFKHASAGTEYLDARLSETLAAHAYPLHFLDFEATQPGIPYFAGMHPYERVAFQWSCHTIREPGGPLEHAEWIDTEQEFPNFSFAETLREHIGTAGTVYMWSSFERTVLREIARQLAASNADNGQLLDWIENVIAEEDGLLVDLEKLARAYYFHPLMKGSTSIKAVLPAVLRQQPEILDAPGLRKYRGQVEADGPVDPYHELPPIELDDGTRLEGIRGGVGAVYAYEDMLFGAGANDSKYKAALRRLLLQYCELDTAAMVMVWERWRRAHGS